MKTCDCNMCWIRQNFPDYELPTPCLAPPEAPDDGPTLLGGWDVVQPDYVSIEGGM